MNVGLVLIIFTKCLIEVWQMVDFKYTQLVGSDPDVSDYLCVSVVYPIAIFPPCTHFPCRLIRCSGGHLLFVRELEFIAQPSLQN
jgi:hypothetical protein